MKLPASILQSTSWPSDVAPSRMLLTFVPFFNTVDEPLTFKSLIRITASPSASGLPFASRTIPSASPFSYHDCLCYFATQRC